MQKKYTLALVIGALLVLSTIAVYAWAFDTDGGFNVWQKGTCSDDLGNHTDYCGPSRTNTLIEYYPTNSTNSTTCAATGLSCATYNATCSNGQCV